MKTTTALLALMSLALAIPMQAMAAPPAKAAPVQQTAAQAAAQAKVKAEQQGTQSSGSAQKATGDMQCRTRKGKPAHCN
ncbi:hypothetical protein [Dyella mobilis]|uniref:Phosphate starvation-inducible protein PsiF n=1 Tax=Dyella mobilis TaxID=1849582 RepID=A0ABS2KE24_9GAMM|nr:hypothetical protein [Dyella mobilis]MBM7128603.1 hypothetical protein [Dyella mobilis]GLQ99493.1 hypothetical protein GCM10007863_39130 [Dyella mobilis]